MKDLKEQLDGLPVFARPWVIGAVLADRLSPQALSERGWTPDEYMPEFWRHPDRPDDFCTTNGQTVWGYRSTKTLSGIEYKVSQIVRELFQTTVSRFAVTPVGLRIPVRIPPSLVPPDARRGVKVYPQDTDVVSIRGIPFERRIVVVNQNEVRAYAEGFLCKPMTDRTGEPRSYMYLPDVRRLLWLTPRELQLVVYDAVDSLSGFIYWLKDQGIEFDPRGTCNSFAPLGEFHWLPLSGDFALSNTMPMPNGSELALSYSFPPNVESVARRALGPSLFCIDFKISNAGATLGPAHRTDASISTSSEATH